ncbi:hypothetical protein [Actinacidiphila glaucinigra]|uniref:hypothetical protein n=1 Tax=Actinacidiphila glaucinigra TaxID=235986 RepID=UPI0036713EDC
MNHPSPTLTTAILWGLLIAGLVCSLSFLLLHRPRHWFRPEAFNAAGWVIISALWCVRSITVLLAQGGPRPYTSWVDAGISLGMLALVDALLVLRLVSWWRYTRRRS